MDEAAGQTVDLLQPGEVAGYLADRGILGPDVPVTVEPLGGGVSNTVFAIHGDEGDLVLKQALPRLRVADTWEADPARALREGVALRTLHALTPEAVPDCLYLDDSRYVIVMPHAPAGWRDWKSRLLTGDADPEVAARLGGLLAGWHLATRSELPDLLRDRTAFDQLRIDPYYRTVMRRRPDLASAMAVALDQLLDGPECLVHGDFSPKNVMLGPDGLWVIDLEVAHHGDPAFDLAFMLSHLVLKAIRRPGDRAQYAGCMVRFAAEYTDQAGDLTPVWEHVTQHVGCLLLARVFGKSPVEYLDDAQRSVAAGFGAELLVRPASTAAELGKRLEQVHAP